MHKSWGNAIWFDEAAETMGVDTMRWLFTNQKLDQNLLFGYQRADEARRRFIIPLWNVYAFFVTYAGIDDWTPPDALLDNPATMAAGQPLIAEPWTDEAAPTVLDRWIIARLRDTVERMTEGYESYHPDRIGEPAEAFLDDLSNWYVRRSRRRFWAARGESEASDADKEAAYQTLYAVLLTFAKLLAPSTPFITEAIYQNLVRSADENAPESIHHTMWPEAEPLSEEDVGLIHSMSAVRQAATLGHSVRSSNQLKVRQPLGQALIAADPRRQKALSQLLDLLADELNVKEVTFVDEEGELVKYQLLPVNRVLGPKFGPRFPLVRKALGELPAAKAVSRINAGESLTLELEDGSEAVLSPDEVLVRTQAREGFGVAGEGGLVVALDTTLTPELEQEGLAREIVRRVQELRKQADYDLTDRIRVAYKAEGALAEAIESYAAMITDEVLADEIVSVEAPVGDEVLEDEVDGHAVVLAVKR
jgi:isoleucyl-tRNA synthetase